MDAALAVAAASLVPSVNKEMGRNWSIYDIIITKELRPKLDELRQGRHEQCSMHTCLIVKAIIPIYIHHTIQLREAWVLLYIELAAHCITSALVQYLHYLSG